MPTLVTTSSVIVNTFEPHIMFNIKLCHSNQSRQTHFFCEIHDNEGWADVD